MAYPRPITILIVPTAARSSSRKKPGSGWFLSPGLQTRGGGSTLNSCKTSDEWSALVREGTPGQQTSQKIATSKYRMAAKKPEPVPQTPMLRRPVKPVLQVEGIPVHFPALKDGTLIVTGTTKTLYFRGTKLRFLRGIRHDVFTHAERTLQQVPEAPAFSEVKSIFIQEYARYLPLRLGPVAEELKKKNDPRSAVAPPPVRGCGFWILCVG